MVHITMARVGFVSAALMSIVSASADPPPQAQKPEFARWLTSSTNWGYLSTISTRKLGTTVGAPFGNPISHAEVQGIPYFYAADADGSMVDLFTSTSPKANPRATLALSMATLLEHNGTASFVDCRIGSGLGDPENPPCARMGLSGVVSKVAPNSTEEVAAKAALFAHHPSFKQYPPDHEFFVAKMSIDAVWLINAYGGAAHIKPADYFSAASVAAWKPATSGEPAVQNVQAQLGSSPFLSKAQIARDMSHTMNWGALSTLSTRSEGARIGDAFGNAYGFADVGGVPYFYASDMDASMVDIFTGPAANPLASLTLSKAALNIQNLAHDQACKIGTYLGDPESPMCARLQLSGTVSKLVANSTEEVAAKAALFARHPSFKDYPAGHHFFVAKLSIDGIWLISEFGGAAIISPSDYFKAKSGAALTLV